MKINGVPGEFAFKAAIFEAPSSWVVTTEYFFSKEEALQFFGREWDCTPKEAAPEVRWPVEVLDNGSIYVPAEEEL